MVAVTGHLGAGKTTLLNHLLRRPGARLGVVVNDFGALNVDAALVAGQIDEAASISGGCLCCLPDAGGLEDALERLSHPRLGLDAVIVEASGAADPIVLSRLIRYSGVERVRPGGVVEVVDAVEHFRTVDVRPDPPARYGVATLIVIGKTDLLPQRERDGTVARIADRVRASGSRAHLVVARHGRIDPALVFDVEADEDPADQLPIGRLLREQHADEEPHDHAAAAAVDLPDTISPSALIDLLEGPPAGAYRLKGRVRVRGPRGDRGYLVNLVGSAIHIAPLPEPPRPGELVAIGMHLDAAEALARLEAIQRRSDDRVDAPGLRRLQRYRRLSD